jgi:hypothetical protein
MRDRDSQLIFESYKNRVFLEADENETSGWEQAKEWAIFAGKVLDPTGISSYPDVIKSYQEYDQDQSLENFALLILNAYTALPNLGLLAAGVGGIGWAALKATAKGAIKSGSKGEIKTIASKILGVIKGSKELQYAFETMCNSMVKNKTISEKAANSIKATIKSGGVSTEIGRKGLEKAIGSVEKTAFKEAGKEYLKKDAPWFLKKIPSIDNAKAMKGQKIARAGREFIDSEGELQYPNFLPQTLASKREGGSKPSQAASPMPTPSFSMKPPTRSESSPSRKKTNPARQPSSGFEMLDL